MRTNSVFIFIRWVLMVFVAFMLLTTGTVQAQQHDLYIRSADNITSTNPAFWKSLDIRIGKDFDHDVDPWMSVPDDNVVWWGASQQLYARFFVNGIDDSSMPPADINNIVIRFYYREANVGDTPPDLNLSDPNDPASSTDWSYIGDLPVSYDHLVDWPFAVGTIWPNTTHFPSVTTRSIEWIAPASGDYFHIRAEVIYPPGYVDDYPTDNVGISLYQGMELWDIDVVILFDVSGSMGYFTYNGSSYLDQAKARVNAFVGAMNNDHNVAVVAFSSIYPNGRADIWPTPIATLQPATEFNKDEILLAINALYADLGTPLGAGLERAIQILSVGAPDRKRAILLLSDGYEGSSSLMACTQTDPAAPCAGQSLVTDLQTNNIRVFTVALGTSAWTECLECLANQSDGQWYGSVDPGIDLGEVCLHMQQIISADDLYRVNRGVSGGGDDIYEVFFEGVDDVLYFVLEWDDLDAALDLRLRPPGSGWSSLDDVGNALIRRGKGYLVVRIENPVQGTWGYRVDGPDGENYMVAVRSDRVNTRLQMDATSQGVVGTPINIKARLTTRGRPVKDAKLIAEIRVPVKTSLETKIRKASRDYIKKYQVLPIDPAMFTKKKEVDISPRAALIHKITEGKPGTLIETRTITVPLRYKGKGVYSGVLEGRYTQIAGKYTVTVKCLNREFHRNFSKQLRLHPEKVDYGKSFAEILRVKSKEEKAIWLLRTYPTDLFGNAITAPSLINRMKASLKDAETAERFKIAFDSSFQRLLKVSPGKKPRLKMLKIDNKKVKVEGGPGKKCWKYGVGAILVLLVTVIIAL